MNSRLKQQHSLKENKPFRVYMTIIYQYYPKINIVTKRALSSIMEINTPIRVEHQFFITFQDIDDPGIDRSLFFGDFFQRLVKLARLSQGKDCQDIIPIPS